MDRWIFGDPNMILKTIRLVLGSPEDKLINKVNELDNQIKDLKENVTQLQNNIDLLTKNQTIEQPKSLGTLSYETVNKILSQMTQNYYISDSYFQTTTKDEALKFSAKSNVWAKKWVAENHDCDNFSFALNGYWSEGLYSFSFGIAWTQLHAFNFFIDNNKQLWIVEPQTNNYMTLETAKKNKNYWPWRVAML